MPDVVIQVFEMFETGSVPQVESGRCKTFGGDSCEGANGGLSDRRTAQAVVARSDSGLVTRRTRMTKAATDTSADRPDLFIESVTRIRHPGICVQVELRSLLNVAKAAESLRESAVLATD